MSKTIAYVCSKCGAKDCKLWRDYGMFLEHTDLFCCDCGAEQQKKDISTLDEYGSRFEEPYIEGGHRQRTYTIGWLVPAVLTEGNDAFWGYTSVPQPAVEAWKTLPNRQAK